MAAPVLTAATLRIERLPSCSPSLLMEQNFQKVEAALVQLHARLPESSVASLVQRQTLYLTEDLEYLLAEVKRCGPGCPAWLGSIISCSVRSITTRQTACLAACKFCS